MNYTGIITAPPQPATIGVFKKINTILNSIDRLEVRGRDSAGISLIFVLKAGEFENFENALEKGEHLQPAGRALPSGTPWSTAASAFTAATRTAGDGHAAVSLVYKVANEVGSLGDNISFSAPADCR